MLKKSSPGGRRRLAGAALTIAIVTGGSYGAWASQPATPVTREISAPGEAAATISAQRIVVAPNGDAVYTGDVIVRASDGSALEWNYSADSLMRRADGSTALTGHVELSRGGVLLTTDAAVVARDGAVHMDSVHIVRTATAGN